MQCPVCKQENLDGAVKCKHCGATMSDSTNASSKPTTDSKVTYTAYSQVPWYRKNWFALCCALFFPPGFLYPLFTGDIYYEKKGELKKYGKVIKIILIVWSLGATLALIDALFFSSPEKEAIKAAQELYYNQYIIECDGMTYIKVPMPLVGPELYRFKNKGKIEAKCFDLTESDKMNGIQAKCETLFSIKGPVQTATGNGFSDWHEGAKGRGVTVWKRSGKWEHEYMNNPYYEALKPLTCEDVLQLSNASSKIPATEAPEPAQTPSATTNQTSSVEKDGICKGLDLAVTAEQMECFDRKYAVADKELNNIYKEKISSLSESRKAALKKEQVAWIKEKESKCANVGKEMEGGTLETVMIRDCYVQMTEKRVEYLKNFK